MARRGEAVSATHAPDVRVAPMDKQLARGEDASLNSFLQAIAEGAGYGSSVTPIKPELLVPDDASRIWSGAVRTSLLTTEVPQGTFLEIKPGPDSSTSLPIPPYIRILIDGPELALVRAAHTLQQMVAAGTMEGLAAKLRLLEFADECCGAYIRDPKNPRTGEVVIDKRDKDTRFTTPEQLQSFLGEVRGLDGLAMVRSIAGHVIDLSGSPMESYFNHAMTLPPRLAGFSMRKPLANRQLVVEDDVAKLLIHDSLRPDFQWPEFHMLAEYLGEDGHADRAARKEDKNRLLDYARASYTPFMLMFDDVRNAGALARTCEMFAREFMKRGVKGELYRVRKILKDEKFRERQGILIRTLLPPLMRY